MTRLVLDGSAAHRLVAGGPGREVARARLRDQVFAEEPILVPHVFWLDVVGRLVDGGSGRLSTVVEAVYELEQLGLETVDLGRPGVLAAIDAVGRGVAAREAPYLVLAESAGAALMTASPLLAAVAGARAILIGERARRAPRPDRSWARWKGAAAYLRELRSALP